MGWKNLILIAVLSLSLIFIKLPTQTRALPLYAPHYTKSELIYDINDNLTVNAHLNFSIVAPSGPSRRYWILSQSRTIPTSDVTDVQVQDSLGGRVNLKIQSNANSTTIQVDFNIYPGEQLDYTVSYKARGLVTKEGPKHQLKTLLGRMNVGVNGCPHDNFKIVVHGPPGAKLFTYQPEETEIVGENLSYETRLKPPASFDGIRGTWYKYPVYYELILIENITNTAIEETSDLQLDLMLFNEEDWQIPSLVETTGPLKTSYVDGKENNWRGIFKIGSISPGESVNFQNKLVYQIKIHDPSISASTVGEITEVPAGLGPYTKSQKYWESDNPDIQEAAQMAVGDTRNSYLVAERIIEFVNDRLNYKIQTDRLGALQAYRMGYGDCSEYTDLSIALARSENLPARAVYGWGYTENGLVGHAWPEFYFPSAGWQPADPTWADTKGMVFPGGLTRPSLVSLSKRFEKLAPTLEGTPGSYLARLDSIHIKRNLRWINSTEPCIKISWTGARPSIEEKNKITLITEKEAAEDFISAAKLSIAHASFLLKTWKRKS